MMRSDKRIKLKLSTNNVKNFPRDFFEDESSIPKNNRYLSNVSSVE